ncbi:hypothetical protein [endosymbiont of Ridgeia piscesae]|jgi:hypothetical protein|uniref:Uncharacterized protein n=1 Tax=endosymbiont of Ridgeia piscesae TaxID=54398 RepID=A0A0T5ZCL3_9GAMM|nr:hypothetical protein [endosymbiont of Ridgeia piscesae]KRT56327.1 hypothetical protein Ga0074115_1409 [endosymbiont of Ridgeia piscesae]KRT60229.1 hypothetical protein Ga0076813_168912 [endosymbiont of Ridgeia piscesae]
MGLRLVSKRKILWASLAGSAGTSAALVGLFLMLLGLNLHTYTKLTAEQVLAKVIVGEKSELGRVLMLRIDGKQPIRLDMPGEEWQLDGRFLKWKAWAALLGKTPNVRLERFSSRLEKNVQAASAPVIIELIESPGAWISAAMNIAEQLGMVDAYYGSSVYMPLAEGAEFIVSATMSGLIARPSNARAEQAVTEWRYR